MPDFGVVGLGSVGWAVIHGLHSHGYSYAGYDLKDCYDWNSILDTKVVLVCTSTPALEDGRLSAGSVEEVLRRLGREGYRGIVVVKSTVPIGFMTMSARRHPNLRLVYMPEFLREKSSYTWFLEPDRIVVAGKDDDVEEVLRYFSWAHMAEIVRTDFNSSEAGKLAHNAFIATKVSFTNEIEDICRRFKGNSRDVMRIVWTDRRVQCSEHLTPGLGAYGGRCVPKDTNELAECSSSILLASVREVNRRCASPETMTGYDPVCVIIPTNDRPSLLERALASVERQTCRPHAILVVSDPDSATGAEVERIVDDLAADLPIKHIINKRAGNVSGAINTGIDGISELPLLANRSFIALLDDDDWWDRRYLENCVKFALETKADWIVSGLIRHDESHTEGFKQRIPPGLMISDFLMGNPNVQNSNLFVTTGALKSIGGYDEALVSTTDRDACIRLLQHNIRYAVLYNHLVHHDGFPRADRLSHPGSTRKKMGLTKFYRKYEPIMSPEQRYAFKERASRLFSVTIPEGYV